MYVNLCVCLKDMWVIFWLLFYLIVSVILKSRAAIIVLNQVWVFLGGFKYVSSCVKSKETRSYCDRLRGVYINCEENIASGAYKLFGRVCVCVCVYYDDPLFSLVNIVNKKKYEDTCVWR